jgi:pilus assembly protein Flp/PilA
MIATTLSLAALSTAFVPQPALARQLLDLLHDDSGQDLIEYALVAATIGLGTVAGVHGLAASVANYLNIVDGGFVNSLAGHV